MRRFLPVCLIALAVLAVGQGEKRRRTEIDAPPILKKAMAAFPRLRYTGVRIVEFKEGPERKRHTENVIRDGANSRVEFPSTSLYAGQIIIETDSKRLHYFPELKEVHVLPARRDEAFTRTFRMLSHNRGKGDGIKITTGAGETVAGMRTEQAVVSDSKGVVLQRLHIHPRSGMILKRELFDRVGTPVGFSEFTQINLNPRIDPAEFHPQFRGVKRVTVEDLARRTAKENQMLAVMLPRSERFQLEHSRMIRIGGNPVFVQMYMSPKGRISLFQTTGPIDTERLGRFGRGTMHTHAWQSSGRNFVLVGELPTEELQRLARLLAR
jgi:outer membrane lipoprotein-sorting protein